MGRKRPRSRLTDDDDHDLPVDASERDHDGSKSETEDVEEDEERTKEHGVWDAFKEEHHEVLEQLPLSLHRQYKLMRELDSQSEVLHADLLAYVRRYIYLRESLAVRMGRDRDDSGCAGVNDADVDGAMQVDSTDLHDGRVNDQAGASKLQPKPGETTRTLLQHIAQTSEEAIRTAEEKVNIAQTAYETVDRHIRLLDQAIKEQEAAISLGARPGTHLAPILLPDLVVPRWARPPRVEHSPVPSLSPEPVLVVEEPSPPPSRAPKKGKKVAAPKPEKEEVQSPAVVSEGDELPVAARTRRTGVRLTIPAQPQPIVPDPNEDRFCYCQQVSFGTMIGCDSPGCKLEWFHLGCTDLLELPSKKTKWYCRECKPTMKQKGRSRV